MISFLIKSKAGKKKLYVHVGFFKTGSTTIQTFLNKNNEWLKSHGVPSVGDPHRFINTGNDISTHEKYSHSLQSVLQEDLDHFLTSSHSSGVISSEFFPRYLDDGFLHWLKKHFDTTIIAVLRNPVSMREAGFQQAVKALSQGSLWGCPAPQDYHWHCESTFLDHYGAVFGKNAVTVLPYDSLNKNGRLLETFINTIGIPDLAGSDIPGRQNERLDYDYFLFLLQSLFFPIPIDIRRALLNELTILSGKKEDAQTVLIIPRENHRACLRLREHELRYLSKEYLRLPDWFEYCKDYLEKQKDADYAELPLSKQRAIFEQLPPDIQEALDRAMPESLKPRRLPPLPTDSASYALMNAWIKHSIVKSNGPALRASSRSKQCMAIT